MKPSLHIAALALGIALAAPCLADVYAYAGEDGTLHLSNVPDDARYALMLAETPEAAETPANQRRYAPLIEETASATGMESALLHAVIAAESGYDAGAVSKKGAGGLMQLMPETARRYGVNDVHDPAENIRGGARYLKDLLRMFGNDLRLTLAAYNAGEGAVVRHGRRIPPYRETTAYVPKVLGLYRKLKEGI